MDDLRIKLPCDGCGLPVLPEHIADRIRRLELSTKFRPVHIGVLFVAFAPPSDLEHDLGGPAKSTECVDPFLDTLATQALMEAAKPEADPPATSTAHLLEFQHRGYHLAYLSECPFSADHDSAASAIARLVPSLLLRIRFNYKPKLIAPLGEELLALAEMLKAAGVGPILTLEHGQPLPVPRTGIREWPELFRRAVASAALRENLSAGV